MWFPTGSKSIYAKVNLEGRTVKKGADEGKSKWVGKSELPSRLWSELSSTERAARPARLLSTYTSSSSGYPPGSPKLSENKNVRLFIRVW